MTTPLVQAVQGPPSPALKNRIRIANHLLAQEPAAPDIATTLRQAIRQARDWQDLEKALERVQAAFEAGQLTQEQVKGLVALAAQEGNCMPELAEEERLGDLLHRLPVVRVRSHLLGEMVVWAADSAQVPADNRLVVWREAELRQMAGRLPEEVRALHALKVAFDGEVIDGDG